MEPANDSRSPDRENGLEPEADIPAQQNPPPEQPEELPCQATADSAPPAVDGDSSEENAAVPEEPASSAPEPPTPEPDEPACPPASAAVEVGKTSEERASEATDSCAEPASEAADPPAAPAAKSAEDAMLAVNQQRGELVEFLFGADRPRSASVEPMVAAYVETVREAFKADATVADQAECLAAETERRHRGAIESEREGFGQAAAKIRNAIDEYQAFFLRLSALVADLQAEVARLDPGDPRLEAVPEELLSRLANYRKGLEIIQRMFTRIVERQKPMAPEPPTALVEERKPLDTVSGPEQLAGFAQTLCRYYHDVRDANYHAVADANKHADGCRQAMFAAAGQLLSAVDGIDSGLANQAELRASLLALVEDESTGTLLDEWLAAYERVDGHVARFFEQVGIVAHTIERGTPFDPERMEPQAVVADPELNDEDVAAMVRRGFSLGDEQIRPIIVDVVRNS